jgi:hypothetical protein
MKFLGIVALLSCLFLFGCGPLSEEQKETYSKAAQDGMFYFQKDGRCYSGVYYAGHLSHTQINCR